MTNEWQSINTAPRDGSLLWLAKGKEVYVGFWCSEDVTYPWVFLDSSVSPHVNAWMDGEWGPTHWQPFSRPEPPNE